jgi:hypothetical protein
VRSFLEVTRRLLRSAASIPGTPTLPIVGRSAAISLDNGRGSAGSVGGCSRLRFLSRCSRHTIALVLGKGRPTVQRGDGSAPQPESGLSEARLALVHRYMVDADDEETRARGRIEPVADVREHAQRETEAALPAVEETRTPAPASGPNVVPHAVVDGASGEAQPDPREEARARKALVKANKQAARRIAALEKREAREMKALAKAAARRRIV